jgi:hypothetical protein
MLHSSIFMENWNSESGDPLSQLYICERDNETLNTVASATVRLNLYFRSHVSIIYFHKLKLKTGACGHFSIFCLFSQAVQSSTEQLSNLTVSEYQMSVWPAVSEEMSWANAKVYRFHCPLGFTDVNVRNVKKVKMLPACSRLEPSEVSVLKILFVLTLIRSEINISMDWVIFVSWLLLKQ